jgi:hypothetical protein
MILLLLEALRRRQRAPDAAGVDIPVLVWLTLGSWEAAPQTPQDCNGIGPEVRVSHLFAVFPIDGQFTRNTSQTELLS